MGCSGFESEVLPFTLQVEAALITLTLMGVDTTAPAWGAQGSE